LPRLKLGKTDTALLAIACLGLYMCKAYSLYQGWGPRGLASTSRTPRGQNFVALALALASKIPGLGLGLGLDDARPWLWLRDLAV